MATQEELEVLFGRGLSEEVGEIMPLPSMPLLAAPPARQERSVAEEVDRGRMKQRETREVPKVAPELDDLRIGDAVPVPGGGTAVITWIDPKRKRIAVGEGRNKTFVSLAEIEKLSGRKIADDINRKRSEENRKEERVQPPEPVTLPADLPKGLYPHQLENVAFLTKYGRGLIADEMGLGKRQPVDTKVLTPDGWRRIGDVAIGDYVIGSAGRPVRVLGVYPQGVQKSFRVRFSDGSYVEAGDEHLWTVAHRKGGKVWETLVVTTEQMRTGARVERLLPSGRTGVLTLGRTALYLPMLGAPAEFKAADVPLAGYIVGQLIANGGLTEPTPNLTTNEWDWEEVRASLGPVPRGSAYRLPGCVRTTFPGLGSVVEALGLRVYSADKRIPRLYFTAPVHERIALLQGLMDADGSISKTRCKVTYHTTSPGLAEDVRELVECLGGIASIREYDRTDEDKPVEYQVRIRMPLSIPPFRVTRKLSRWKPGTHALPCRTFVSAEYVRDVDSVCIKVDADDQLYVTEHAILTHNTISAAVCVEAPAVVVCPSLLKVNWSRELAKWKPEMTVTMVSGTNPDAIEAAQKRADVVVINYDILHAHVDWLAARDNRTLVADEAHYLKNLDIRWNKVARRFEPEKKSPRRAVAFHALRQGIKRLFLLTGTPILNRAKELFPLLHLLDPDTWSSGYQYCMRYCAGHYEFLKVRGGSRKVFNCSGRSNSEELHARINGIYMMRHTKEAELKNLPAKRRSSITVSLSPEYAKTYRKARNEFLRWVEEQGGPEAVARAQQAQALVQLTKLRAVAAAGKAEAAVNYIVDFWESTQRPLGVMGVHRDAFDLIAAGLDEANKAHYDAVQAGRMPEMARPIRYGMVVGGMSEGKRQEVIDGFQTKGTIDVILYSIPIATGTTLTRASDALFLERMWRPADQLQAEDRFHRIGQENHVSITYMDGEGTLDLKLGHLLMEKSETAAAIIDGHNLTAEESSGLVFGEMFGLLEDVVAGVTPNRREPEEPRLRRGPVPRIFGDDGERFDAHEWDDDELVSNPAGVYESYLDDGLLADSWGDPL